MVNVMGENAACVSPGANMLLRPQDIEAAEDVIAQGQVCLIHAELPEDAIVSAVRLAKLHKLKVLLDPAFGLNGNTRNHSNLPIEYFTVDVLLPNIQQAAELADEPAGDIHKAKLVGSDLVARGAENVVIKMGRRGCLIVNRQGTEHVAPFEVDMIDRTCAGDAFAGALAASIAVGDTISSAVRFAAAAGALACTKFGCLDALPRKEEIIELLHRS
jgi:ribokinase